MDDLVLDIRHLPRYVEERAYRHDHGPREYRIRDCMLLPHLLLYINLRHIFISDKATERTRGGRTRIDTEHEPHVHWHEVVRKGSDSAQ